MYILQNLPSFHVKIRLAMVTPRILPQTEFELLELRHVIEKSLDELLHTSSGYTVDSSPPLYHGFSTGYFLAFHGYNSLMLKRKLYQLYILYCPSLEFGYFANPITGEMSTKESIAAIEGKKGTFDSDEMVGHKLPAWIDAMQTDAIIDLKYKYHASTLPHDVDHDKGDSVVDENGHSSVTNEIRGVLEIDSNGNEAYNDDIDDTDKDGRDGLGDDAEDSEEVEKESARTGEDAPSDYDGNGGDKGGKTGKPDSHSLSTLRIGFASRFFYQHPIGYLSEGLIALLSEQQLNIILFVIDGFSIPPDDIIQSNIISNVQEYYLLPPEITSCITALRNAKLDILVYPEIGLDPIVYFMAFSMIAPIQATWMGHIDTTGMNSIQYFISDVIEEKNAEITYNEELVRMHGMGACFIDHYHTYSSLLMQPRNVLLERAKFIEALNIPRVAHVYVIVQQLYILHPSFDEIIRQILVQDKLGYVILLDDGMKLKPTWKSLVTFRIIGKLSPEISDRFKFLTDVNEHMIFKAMGAAHVVLDTFPSSDYLYSMQALALGTPVITMPSLRMIGRVCLSLYTRLNYFGLVVHSHTEYINLALTIAHKPKIRQAHVDQLIARRDSLFDCSHVVHDWLQFFQMAAKKLSHSNYTSISTRD